MDRLVSLYRVTSSTVAVGLLLFFNLAPLAGVIWWGWDLFAILALYWVENGIVGAINVVKILSAQGSSAGPLGFRMCVNGRPVSAFSRGPIAAFFLVHYGGFWVGHGLFVLVFLPLMAGTLGGGTLIGGQSWGLIGIGAIGLAISHAASFWLNYLGRGEYLVLAPAQLMLAPYGRLVILHVTIVLGAFVSITVGSPVGALLVLVVLKTALDLVFHLREHRRLAEAQAPAPSAA